MYKVAFSSSSSFVVVLVVVLVLVFVLVFVVVLLLVLVLVVAVVVTAVCTPAAAPAACLTLFFLLKLLCKTNSVYKFISFEHFFWKNNFPKFERFGTPRVFLKNMDIARKRASTKRPSFSGTNLTVV